MAAPELAPPSVNIPLQAGRYGNSLSAGAANYYHLAKMTLGIAMSGRTTVDSNSQKAL